MISRTNYNKLTILFILGIILALLSGIFSILLSKLSIINLILILILIVAIISSLIIIITKKQRKLEGYIFYLLIFVSTFAANYPLTENNFSVPHQGISPIPELWVSYVPLVSLVFLFLAKVLLVGNIKIRHSPIVTIFSILILWQLLGSLGAKYPALTIWQIIKLSLPGLLALIITLNLLSNIQDLKNSLHVFLAVGLLHSLYGIAQWFNGGVFGLSYLGELSRTNATSMILESKGISKGLVSGFNFGPYISGFMGKYCLVGLLLLLLPVSLLLVLSKEKFASRFFAGTFFVFGLITSFLIFSKSGWGAVVGAITLSIIIAFLRKDLFSRRRISALFIIFLVLGGVGIAIFWPVIYGRIFRTNLVESFTRRVDLLRFAFGSFIENPIIGVGGNNLAALFPGVAGGAPPGTPVHNIFVLYLAELGLPGFMLFSSIVFYVSFIGYHSVRKNTGFPGLISIGALAGLMGFFAHGVFSWVYNRPQLFIPFWIFVGLFVRSFQIGKDKLARNYSVSK